jgi:RNA-binding protein 39
MKMQIAMAPIEFNPVAAQAAAAAAAQAAAAAAPPPVPEPPAMDERLVTDADDGGGMRLTAQSRVALMSRLAATAGLEVPQIAPFGAAAAAAAAAAPSAVSAELAMQQGRLGPASPIPTPCLLLKNMFDPAE